MKTLLRLFWEFFKISLFVVGGGYAIIVVADEVCSRLGWTKEGELLDQLPVFQLVPGLIATHTAVYVGRKVSGPLGAAIAVLAVALPAVVIFTLVAALYDSLPVDNPQLKCVFTGLRAALTGIIAAAVIRTWKKNLGTGPAKTLGTGPAKTLGTGPEKLGTGPAKTLGTGPEKLGTGPAYLVMILAVAALLAGVASWLVVVVAVLFALARAVHSRFFANSALPLLLFAKYGAICFGGGFVMVPMYMEDFVGATAPYLSLSLEEFSNMMALSQMTPGPIGVNAATFFGYRLCGVGGAWLASALLLLPGCLAVYAVLAAFDRGAKNQVLMKVLDGLKPVSLSLMLVALFAFAKVTMTGLLPVVLTLTVMVVVMKKKLNVIATIWLTALVALGAGSLGAAETNDTSLAALRQRYPDADTVVLDEAERVRYNPNGTYELWEESWVKILTERGRRSESSTRLDYSKRYGSGEITYVGAIDEKGVERQIDVSSTMKEATDNSSMSANIYDPLDRVITCTIPGLKIGETVHVKTHRLATKPRCEGKWADLSVMEWSHPILKSTYEVTAPAALPLRRIAIRHPLGNLTTNVTANADGTTTYSFVANGSEQVFPEPDMPPLFTQVQCVRVSTAESWPEISRWYHQLCEMHLAKTNAALVAKVRELQAGAKEREAQLRAIFKFVSQEVRYMGLTMEDTSPGYAPHDVDVTFDNRYGVCRDKAGLLVAMLRVAGFKAYPVLIHVGAKLDEEVPQPFFNHAIVAVEKAAQDGTPVRVTSPERSEPRSGLNAGCAPSPTAYILMDPTNENTKDLFPSYLCNCSYLVCRPEGERLRLSEVPDPARHELQVTTDATLGEDGSIFALTRVEMNGINDTAYRAGLVKKNAEDRQKFFERVVKGVAAGAELSRCEITPEDLRDTEKPIVIELAVKYPEMRMEGATRESLALPFLSGSLGIVNYLLRGNTALIQRKYPLVIDTTACVREELRLKIGEKRTVELPQPVKMTGKCRYRLDYAFTNGTLVAHRENALAAVEFDPEEYEKLRDAVEEIEAAERHEPALCRDRTEGADVHYYDIEQHTTTLGDRSWVTTNHVVKEVLTYAGKKGSSELKFGFNPLWKKVEVVSATVSNRNGKVVRVSPREQNVMDAGWVSSAPRYPAGKLLVVNLPSVEIGSVIDYTVVSVVSNAPAGFYGEFDFEDTDPVERYSVRVNDWHRELRHLPRLPDEPSQPRAELWRDVVVVSSNRFGKVDLQIAGADDLGADAPPSEFTDVRELRDWMAKYVKVLGPSLYELPIESQLTPIRDVLRERYGTRLDYVRTLAALLRAAGHEADVVFAAGNANLPDSLRRRMKFEHPNVRAFSIPLCRVTERSGGVFGLGGEERVTFIGTENEYAEMGASALENSDYYDPERGEFGIVTVPEKSLVDCKEERTFYDIREDGAVDLEVENLVYGPEVASFRRTYSEILPEMRFRRYQAILGGISQAAKATSALETEVERYPVRRHFTCHVPELATVNGDVITLELPALVSSIPSIAGTVRKTPFALSAAGREVEKVTVRFPEGYTAVEHLPAEFSFANPLNPSEPWVVQKVSTVIRGNVLDVTIEREVSPRKYCWFGAQLFELVKDWSRTASSKANRTLAVRRKQ